MPELFVVYAYSTGFGNIVFSDRAPPANYADVQALEQRIREVADDESVTLMDWKVLGS